MDNQIKKMPMPRFTDDEAYLRLGYPDGLKVETDQPMTCSPIDGSSPMMHNPLTEKGKEIMSNMEKEYGPKKAKQVFYASANKGRIKGVHK